MKKEILLELASRWENDAKALQCVDGGDHYSNAKAEAIRETKRECADALRMLVQLLG